MAGGKETPRQKMIGMMYLVLTALLALNMSKAVLDAFVSIDSNVQDANRAVTKKANFSLTSLKDVAEDKTEPGRAKKANFWLNIAKQIREKTDEQINIIDDIKVKLLKEVGETDEVISTIVKQPETEGGRRKFDISKCTKKDNYDIPMLVMIGEGGNIKNPKPDSEGMKIWNNLLQFRNEITSIFGSYTLEGGKTYSFNPNESLSAELQDYSKAHPEDTTKLKQLYSSLTLPERSDLHDGEIKNVHWIGKTFDHAPVVAAIAQLTALQTTILNAEAEAMEHIRQKVGGGEYSFNKIASLCYGQEYANVGDSVGLTILMAAYDSNKDPKVFIDGKDGKEIEVTSVGDGVAKYSFKAVSNDSITGRIGIQNKSGEWRYKTFKKGISVGKPSGVVSLPEMNVLYKGYDNIVQGAATGFQTYSLSGSGCTLKKNGDKWIANVPKTSRAKEAFITISGKNSDGSSANLGKYTFRVNNMPTPSLFLGNLNNGGSFAASSVKSQAALFCKYEPGIPLNAKFTVKNWILSSSTGERKASGNGYRLNDQAKSLLKQAKKGTVITIFCTGSSKGGSFRQTCSITVK